MKIRIDFPHHPYDIQIEKGCLAQAGQWLRELWQPQKVVIVTDNHVASLSKVLFFPLKPSVQKQKPD